MAANSVTESGKIIHGRIDGLICGAFAVFYLCANGNVGASCSGIQSAERCDERASEYSRSYNAPIVSPMLCPTVPFVDVAHETAYGTTCRFSNAVRVY